MKEWYHGTNVYFENWSTSNTTTVFKRELIPHSFISLSVDEELLKGAGVGRCKATINEDARVVNLLEDSTFSKALWENIRRHPFGSIHVGTKSLAAWETFCSTGQILRPYISESKEYEEWEKKLKHMPENNQLDKIFKVMVQQNFVRHWIEFFMREVRKMGVDGIICNEHTQHGNHGPRTSENLYFFNLNKISPPVWIKKPDNSKLEVERQTYERGDIKSLINKVHNHPYPFNY